MTKSRRVMAVIVAALLIVAMILPGLAVKAEAADGEGTGEAGRADAKVTIDSKDKKHCNINRENPRSGHW